MEGMWWRSWAVVMMSRRDVRGEEGWEVRWEQGILERRKCMMKAMRGQSGAVGWKGR